MPRRNAVRAGGKAGERRRQMQILHTESADVAVGIRIDSGAAALFHRGQNLGKWQRRERCRVVGYPVGNDELPAMHEAAA